MYLCDNPGCQNPAASMIIGRTGNDVVVREISQIRRILKWLLVAVLAALVSYFSFRSYLSPELLFNFANSFTC